MKNKLRKIFVGILLASFVFSSAACSSGKNVAIKVYNWGDYIDESVIKDFEDRYGISVIYDTFTTNEDMYIKIKAGGDNYDVAFPSDYMIKRMIKEDLIQKIDMDNIPNYRYIDGRFKNLPYDPKNEYSVPYMWGTVGILYNKKMVNGPVDSWKVLWDPRYKKQILMQDSQRDGIGIKLKMLGYSLNTRNTDELEAAKNALIQQKPLVLAYVVDEVKDKMIGNEAALAVVWSGDAVFCKRENKDPGYAVPKEGSNLWFDCMVIPKSSKHKKEAEMFINYMCETDVALKNTQFIGYSTPHTGAMKKLDPEVFNDRTAYPPEEDLKNCEVYEDLSDSLKEYDRIWTEVKAKQPY